MSTTNGEVSLEGSIDCDGHILEPPDLWEHYLEPQYRERAIRIKTDDEGWEYFEFDGKPSPTVRARFPRHSGCHGPAGYRTRSRPSLY